MENGAKRKIWLQKFELQGVFKIHDICLIQKLDMNYFLGQDKPIFGFHFPRSF